MSELPANARGIAIEVEAFRGFIVEVDVHLHEIEDGNDIELFPGLPDSQDDDNHSHLRSSVIGAPFGVKHDRGNAEEGEVDHKSLYYNETRNQDEMDIDLFDPVWQPDRPFPGEIPEEISEYLGSPEYPRSGTFFYPNPYIQGILTHIFQFILNFWVRRGPYFGSAVSI